MLYRKKKNQRKICKNLNKISSKVEAQNSDSVSLWCNTFTFLTFKFLRQWLSKSVNAGSDKARQGRANSSQISVVMSMIKLFSIPHMSKTCCYQDNGYWNSTNCLWKEALDCELAPLCAPRLLHWDWCDWEKHILKKQLNKFPIRKELFSTFILFR